jgi:hypothetical protein
MVQIRCLDSSRCVASHRRLDRTSRGKRQPKAVLTRGFGLSGVTGVASKLGSDVPGQELVDLVDRMFGDA